MSGPGKLPVILVALAICVALLIADAMSLGRAPAPAAALQAPVPAWDGLLTGGGTLLILPCCHTEISRFSVGGIVEAICSAGDHWRYERDHWSYERGHWEWSGTLSRAVWPYGPLVMR